MKRLIPLALLGLAACAQPEPIVDYNAPYTGKYSAPEVSPRPEPRPTTTQRRWPACPNWPDDCGNGGVSAKPAPDIWEHQAPLIEREVISEPYQPEPEPEPEACEYEVGPA